MDPDLLAEMRRNYSAHGLNEAELDPDPISQFRHWFADVVRADLPEPNAMVLSTASPDGQPSARTVLLKGFDDRGFVFYTNYTSRKAAELAANPKAALLFPWHAIARQVIVVGSAEWVTPEQSATYFRSRPHASQLAAWASRQSAVIESRSALEERFARMAVRFPPEDEVPVPDFWGGVRVVPDSVEFWQGRPGRLHDRLVYQREADTWRVQRLSP